MKFTAITGMLLSSAVMATAAVLPNFSGRYRIPTSYESAVLGRRILALTPIGTISTVFPPDESKVTNIHDPSETIFERSPAGRGGMPYSLMEYIADCEDDDLGNPTILAVTIGTTFRNVAAGSNVSLAVQWTPPHPPVKRIRSERKSWFSYLGLGTQKDDEEYDSDSDSNLDGESYHHLQHDEEDDDHHHSPSLPYSAANLPRFSLIGYLEPIPDGDDLKGEVGSKLASCFVRTHPDAKYWLPGNKVHESHFVRMVVQHVYWVGGFGDRAYIGWIPIEEW